MSESKGCWKVGCIGCATLVGLPILFLILLAVLQVTVDWGEPDPERAEVERALPGEAMPEAPPPEAEAKPISPEELAVARTIVGGGATGTVHLDLSMGSFRVRPGPAGSQARIEADFDKNAFELVEKLEESADGSWRYDVRFGAKGGMLGLLMRGGMVDDENEVTLWLPPDHPFRLEGYVRMGKSEIDLGGLAVSAVDLELGLGDHLVEFRDPTSVPMESFRVEGSMGNLDLFRLGNASPAEMTIDHSMGDLELELDGAWRADATLDLQLGMGSGRIKVPRTVRVEIEEMSVAVGETRIDDDLEREGPEGAPTLRVSLRGRLGDLRID